MSGCIAVSGGLEVASDRLLKLIDKGVTIAQVAKVTDHFTQAGIMVHAYLMYGYPTQNEQETIDSLEVVRQLFEAGIVQSGFWHQFALTAHSPVGKNPAAYNLKLQTETIGTFANNDLEYEDLSGCDHGAFSEGLKKSLFNYMNGICFEYELQDWFDFEVPETTISESLIADILSAQTIDKTGGNKRVLFTIQMPELINISTKKTSLIFNTRTSELEMELDQNTAIWFSEILQKCSFEKEKGMTYSEFAKSYDVNGFKDFDLFFNSEDMISLREMGLLIV